MLKKIQDLEDKSVPPTGKAYAWIEGNIIYTPAESCELMFPREEARKSARCLHAVGSLIEGEGRNLMKKTPRPVPTRPRAYALRLGRLGITTHAAKGRTADNLAAPMNETA